MIRVVPDVVAPAVVTGVDIATLELKPDWNEMASYIIAGAAYVVSGLGLIRGNGGDFVKNMGIAALPLAARNLYMRVKSPVSRSVSAKRMVLQHDSSNLGSGVSRSYQHEFESVSPHAF